MVVEVKVEEKVVVQVEEGNNVLEAETDVKLEVEPNGGSRYTHKMGWRTRQGGGRYRVEIGCEEEDSVCIVLADIINLKAHRKFFCHRAGCYVANRKMCMHLTIQHFYEFLYIITVHV